MNPRSEAFALLWLVIPGGFAAEPGDFYTQTGTDPTFQELLDSGVIVPGDPFAPGPVVGSGIDVNHALLEQQTGIPGPIPQNIRIHTQVNSSISRSDFSNFTRWYQEDGDTQVFRLFEGEQNVRSGVGENGSPGRIEAFFPFFTVASGTWSVWEGTYTIIDPLSANIFQLFHDGGQLWPFHIRMTASGSITFNRRREEEGLPKNLTLATGMAGKSLSIRVRADGTRYEVYRKVPLVDDDWTLVTIGSYIPAVNDRISFRWGTYVGSQPGQSVPKDGLLFVSGVTRSTSTAPPAEPPVTAYFWDNNGDSPGFGIAGGVWAGTTTGDATQGWSEDESGGSLPSDVTTTTGNPVHFGTDAPGGGLGSGTITVSGLVNCADIIFGSQSGDITLSGGEIQMAGSRGITVAGSGATHRIESVLSGADALTIDGGGTLALDGANSYTGPTAISGGMLLLGGPDALPGGNLTLDGGGVVGLGAGGFSRSIGAGPGQFRWTGDGGFAAFGADREVSLGDSTTNWTASGFIGGGNTLTLGDQSADATLRWKKAISLAGGTRTVEVRDGPASIDATMEAQVVGGSGGTNNRFRKTGAGTLAITAQNSHWGDTLVDEGTLMIGNGGTGGGISRNSPTIVVAAGATLAVNRSNTVSQGTDPLAVPISGGGGFAQVGPGTTVLAAANTYTGPTTIAAGTLALGAADSLPDASPVVLGAALLDAGTVTATAGGLSVIGPGTIRLGSGAALAFADSSGLDWGGGSLTLSGDFVSGVSLRFGTDDGGLTPVQLASISCDGFTGFALDGDGFLTASLESGGYSAWAAIHAPSTGGDPAADEDGDGVANALEYVLGGTLGIDDRDKLPEIAVSGETMAFTFVRDRQSLDGTTEVVIQTGPDLVSWPDTYPVPSDAVAASPGVSVTTDTPGPGLDTVVLTLPMQTVGRIFVRLAVSP